MGTSPRERRGEGKRGEKAVVWKICVEIPLRTRWTQNRGDEIEAKHETERKLRKA
jgi:hypothetical protein